METGRIDVGDTLERAVRVLNAGGVAVIPTDTVYGLAASPHFPAAVERLYAIKGRAARKPIALLAADAEAAVRSCGGMALSPAAETLARRHWPGALTLVLPAGSGGFEGVRVPDHPWTRALLARCGGSLRVTSANLSGRREATEAEEALAAVGLSADFVADGGRSAGGVASTVVRADRTGCLAVLRPGPKPVLRTAMRLMRRALAPAERARRSEAACADLLERETVARAVAEGRPIAVHFSTPDEVDVDAFVRAALARGAELCAPRWNGETYALSRVGTACGAVRLRSGPMGVREPDEDLPVAPSDVAAWLVPGLAFGRDGTRVGYGGGWYDRLLAAAAAEARIVGVAFGFQVFDALAAESHDARVHELCLC